MNIEIGSQNQLDVNFGNDDNLNIETGNVNNIYYDNYELLRNKPQINSVELIDNKSFEDLGAVSLTNQEIEDLLNNQA